MKKRSKYLSQSSVLMYPYIPKWKLDITTMNNAKNLMMLDCWPKNKGKLSLVVSATDQIACSKFIALVKVPPDLFKITNPSIGSRIKSNDQPESVRPSVSQSVNHDQQAWPAYWVFLYPSTENVCRPSGPCSSGRVLPTMAYTGKLRPKGVPFWGLFQI